MAQSIFEAVQLVGPILALLLQARLMSRFFDSRNRDYPVAILFTLVLFFLTLVAYAIYNHRALLAKYLNITITRNTLQVYAALELFMYILLLILMLQLIRKTLIALEQKERVIYLLAALSVLVAVSAYTWFQTDASTARTFLRTRQVVSFWMVLLNLYWWTLLLRKRTLDRRILLLSAGIGLLMTGQVISDGVNAIDARSAWLGLLAALIMYATHFACLITWYNAFNPANSSVPSKIRPSALDQSLT